MKIVKESLNYNYNIREMSLEELISIAPYEIKKIFKKSKTTPQTIKWHPEFDVYSHTKIVFNRAKNIGDIDLMLAAVFHDTGKVFVTTKKPDESEGWSAKGHEKISAQLVEKYRDWIENIGGDYEKIHYIVSQHMRGKEFDNMRPYKQNVFRQHKYYDDINKFMQYDTMINKDTDDFNE
jgi:hypothetical protein